MRLTREILEARKACAPQAEIFNTEFPDGMEFTRDNLERCVALELDIAWASRLIQPDKRAAYLAAKAPAWAAYLEAKATAWAAYLEARDTAAAYRAALATAAAYLEARDTAAAHQAARDTTWAAHQAAIIDALVVALGGE
jgi:hypothetical protein